MVTTIELVIDIKLETEFAPKSDSFGAVTWRLANPSNHLGDGL
jgi:hypothetical protein